LLSASRRSPARKRSKSVDAGNCVITSCDPARIRGADRRSGPAEQRPSRLFPQVTIASAGQDISGRGRTVVAGSGMIGSGCLTMSGTCPGRPATQHLPCSGRCSSVARKVFCADQPQRTCHCEIAPIRQDMRGPERWAVDFPVTLPRVQASGAIPFPLSSGLPGCR
jgi:hypothetical protein